MMSDYWNENSEMTMTIKHFTALLLIIMFSKEIIEELRKQEH